MEKIEFLTKEEIEYLSIKDLKAYEDLLKLIKAQMQTLNNKLESNTQV